MITILNAAFLLDPSTDQMPAKPPPVFPAPSAAPGPDAVDYEPILALIARLHFRAARKTDRFGKPQIPHAYTVRKTDDPEADATYLALYHAIQRHGRIEKFGRYKRHYLYPGDGRKYWAMTHDHNESRIINRMWIADDVERMRRTGQLP